MQIGPFNPVGMQLQKAEVGPTILGQLGVFLTLPAGQERIIANSDPLLVSAIEHSSIPNLCREAVQSQLVPGVERPSQPGDSRGWEDAQRTPCAPLEGGQDEAQGVGSGEPP
jgi:hypothetical protein